MRLAVSFDEIWLAVAEVVGVDIRREINTFTMQHSSKLCSSCRGVS